MTVKRVALFVLFLIIVAVAILGGSAAYRFNIDPDTPLGKSSNLVDIVYNWEQTIANRLYLNERYGLNLQDRDIHAIFDNTWNAAPGSYGENTQVVGADGNPVEVYFEVAQDEEKRTVLILRNAATDEELPLVQK